MSRFREVFANRHVILPVVHVESLDQAERNARIARDAGADGVFLINHGMADEQLLEIHDRIAQAQADWWVGVNCLGLTPEEVVAAASPKVSGIWVDNALIEEGSNAQPAAERISTLRRQHGWSGLYFGGVAFKYQRSVGDLASACRVARRYMDVVTTSGPGTGHAAEVDKIRSMKAALDDFPLAIASGITPENVGSYLPFADCFLSATGISRSFTELDPRKTQDLVERTRST